MIKQFDDQPNLVPPITTTDQALAYKAELEGIDPNVQYLMTLYLSPDLTVDEVKKAKQAGIVGQFLESLSKFALLLNLLSYIRLIYIFRRQIIPKRCDDEFRWGDRIVRNVLSSFQSYGTSQHGSQHPR